MNDIVNIRVKAGAFHGIGILVRRGDIQQQLLACKWNLSTENSERVSNISYLNVIGYNKAKIHVFPTCPLIFKNSNFILRFCILVL